MSKAIDRARATAAVTETGLEQQGDARPGASS
jgi:hypothetical protein